MTRSSKRSSERTHSIAHGWEVSVYPDPENRRRSLVRIHGPNDLCLEVLDDGRSLRQREQDAIKIAGVLYGAGIIVEAAT